MPQQKLILDVDTGIDDAMALLYALASPDAELLVATCAPGNVNLEAVVRNTRGVLDVAGASHIDVIAGARTPLVKALVTTHRCGGASPSWCRDDHRLCAGDKHCRRLPARR